LLHNRDGLVAPPLPSAKIDDVVAVWSTAQGRFW